MTETAQLLAAIFGIPALLAVIGWIIVKSMGPGSRYDDDTGMDVYGDVPNVPHMPTTKR